MMMNISVPEFQINCKIKTFVVVCYRPPDRHRDIAPFFECLATFCATGKPVIACGDFNLPEIDWCSNDDPILSVRSAHAVEFLDGLSVHGLTQSVHGPTRGDAILDLVLSCGGDIDTTVTGEH